jgi:hypothetical protein
MVGDFPNLGEVWFNSFVASQLVYCIDGSVMTFLEDALGLFIQA